MIRERELRRFDREQDARNRKMLEDAIAGLTRLRAVNAKLEEALEPFAALLMPHVEETAYQGDATGVFGINEVKITVGDLRRAREAVEEARK